MFYYIRRNSLDTACILTLVFIFLFGTSLPQTLLVAMAGIFAAAALTFVLSFFSLGKRLVPYRRTLLVCLFLILFGLFGCFRIAKQNHFAEKVASETQNTHQITGYVTEVGSEGNFGTDTVTVTEIDGKECRFRLSLLRTNHPSPTPYRYFTAEVTLHTKSSFTPAERADNIALDGEASRLTQTERVVKTPSSLFFSLGNRLQNLLHKNLPKDCHGLTDALLLGRRNGLSNALNRDFRTLGITHLLSVSGMHLSILCGALLYLLAKFRASSLIRFLVCGSFIFLYCGLCGFIPSILRAALMSICLLLANLAGEKLSGVRSLLLSLTVILLSFPNLVYDLSLQLSVLATLGILLLFPLFRTESKQHTQKGVQGALWKFLFLPFALTLSATVFTLPVIYLRFGSFSLVSPLSNLIFVPLFTLLMYLLPIFLLSCCVPHLSALISPLVSFLCRLIEDICPLARYCKDLYCHIPAIVLWILILCLAGALVLYRYKIRFGGVITALALCLCLSLAYPFSLKNDTRLLYACNGERESILWRQENSVLYIETGNGSVSNAYTALTLTNEQLKQTGIDSLVLTHYHAAQSSFLGYLLDNTYLDDVYLPAPRDDAEAAYTERLQKMCQDNKVSAVIYETDTELSVNACTLTVHNAYLHRSEHPAQAIALCHGSSRVLLADPAVFELDGLGSLPLDAVDHLIFLQSAPVDKYPLPPFSGASGVHAVYADHTQFTTITCPFSHYTILSPEHPHVFIRFNS